MKSIDLKTLLFSFHGRISRLPFWVFTLFVFATWLSLALMLGIDFKKRYDPGLLIFGLLFLWPSLAVQAKRWHDRNKSAWWILIGLVPIVGPLWAFIENGFLAGTAGENRFGADPLEDVPQKIDPVQAPERKYEEIRHAPSLQQPPKQSQIIYKGFLFVDKGFKTKKEAIIWDRVKEIKYSEGVIAGYGAATMAYTDRDGQPRTALIRASATEQYQEVIRYIIQHCPEATVDPGLLNVLEYPPKDAGADVRAILLFFSGLILFIFSYFIVAKYSPTLKSSSIYPLITVLLAGVPMLATIYLIVSRLGGKTVASSKKILWSSLINLGAIVSPLIFFLLLPFSFYYLMGDLYARAGDLDKAEKNYQIALTKVSDSIDVLYEVGKLHREKKDYEKALNYLERAYRRDPSYWGPAAVVLIPDTLLKMKRHEDALEWCKKILRDNPDRIGIARAISDKQDEIIWERDHDPDLKKEDQDI